MTQKEFRLSSPGMSLTSDQLVRALAPQAKALRERLFGGPRAPFTSLKAAAEWIESNDYHATLASMTKEARERFEADRHEGHRVLDAATEMAFGARDLLQQTVYGAHTVNTLLDYAKPGSRSVHRVAADKPSPLYTLASKTEEMADRTGFSETALVAWVLVGIRPSLPTARIEVNPRWTKGIGHTRTVKIEVFVPGFTPSAWARLYDRVQAELGVTRYDKPLTAKHQALMEIVTKLGGPPTGTRRGAVIEFWERVRANYQRKTGTEYTSWRGPMMLYRRLAKKLEIDGAARG